LAVLIQSAEVTVFKGRRFWLAQDLFCAMVLEMNEGLEARKAQRLLWAVVTGFVLLNAVIVYFALRPGGNSPEESSELRATTNVLQSVGTNRP